MRYLFIVVISIFLVYGFWPSPPEPSENYDSEGEVEHGVSRKDETLEISPEPQKKKLQVSETKPKPIQVEKSLNRKPDPIQGERRLPPGVVEFELLKNNWAVAHGDILLGKLETQIDGTRGQFKPKRSVLWDSADIAYGFGPGFSPERVEEIRKTLEIFSQATAVNFFEFAANDPPQDYLVFVPSDEICASYLGKTGGQQPIFLKQNCGPKEITHEIMHALGFIHEQSRADRDRYVKINWENIKEGYENQFDIAPPNYLENYRGFVFSFDYQSVMLYSSKHFTKAENLNTIESTTNKEIAPSNGLSSVDIQRVDYLYGNL